DRAMSVYTRWAIGILCLNNAAIRGCRHTKVGRGKILPGLPTEWPSCTSWTRDRERRGLAPEGADAIAALKTGPPRGSVTSFRRSHLNYKCGCTARPARPAGGESQAGPRRAQLLLR